MKSSKNFKKMNKMITQLRKKADLKMKKDKLTEFPNSKIKDSSYEDNNDVSLQINEKSKNQNFVEKKTERKDEETRIMKVEQSDKLFPKLNSLSKGRRLFIY